MRYYELARLQQGVNLRRGEKRVQVDLTQLLPTDHILNDEQLKAARAPGAYFYLSGGGSVIFNRRFVPVVRRPAHAAVNPGLYSLFTGRADSEAEWANPDLLVRELHEELKLYRDGKPLELSFERVLISNITLEIKYKNGVSSCDGFLHWGPGGEMNWLFWFAAEVDMTWLSARDGEADGGGRQIYLLDLEKGSLQEFSGEKCPALLGICSTEQMTPHLACWVEMAKKWIAGTDGSHS